MFVFFLIGNWIFAKIFQFFLNIYFRRTVNSMGKIMMHTLLENWWQSIVERNYRGVIMMTRSCAFVRTTAVRLKHAKKSFLYQGGIPTLCQSLSAYRFLAAVQQRKKASTSLYSSGHLRPQNRSTISVYDLSIRRFTPYMNDSNLPMRSWGKIVVHYRALMDFYLRENVVLNILCSLAEMNHLILSVMNRISIWLVFFFFWG